MNPRQNETSLRSLISPVQLSTTDSVSGTIFYKQLFSFGTWANPMWWWDGEPTMELTVDMATKMVDNFNKKVLGSPVPVPRNHTDDVNANAGEVVKLEVGTDGLYGYLDVRDPKTVDDINNGLIFDVSIGFDWDYISQKDSTHYGPTLYHVALVNTPYINNMSGFTEAELAKRNHEYAAPLTVAGRPSVIMMSIDKVEELKHMIKFSKVTNDKAFPVEVTYKDQDGKEVKQTVEAGAEIEVDETAADSVTKQITDAVDPDIGEDGLTDEERQTKAKEEQDKKDADEAEAKAKADADAAAAAAAASTDNDEPAPIVGEQGLAAVRAENAELKAKDAYIGLLSKGKIVPAQKDLFMGLAKQDLTVKFAKPIEGVKLSKDNSTSVLVMLSAILEAGATQVKFGEQGGSGNGGVTAELTKEQEEKIVAMGFSVEKFKSQLAKGNITLKALEGDK